MLDVFPQNTISFTYKRNNNLSEILSLSLFPRTTKQNEFSIEKRNKNVTYARTF